MNLVATCDVRELRASQVSHRFSRNGNPGGRATGRCRGVMFMDVEHRHAGARRLDLGTANGTWGFNLVASSARAESCET